MLERMMPRWVLPVVAIALSSGVMWPRTARAADLLDEGVDQCANAYYGIGEPIDYRKAYQCFESLKVWQFMIVMQLNGQGVPVSAEKAREYMQDWLKADPMNANSVDETQMEKMIRERKGKKLGEYPKVDFCQDVGYTTYSMDFCASVQDRLEQAAFDATMSSIRSSLSPPQQVLWDEIQQTLKNYEEAEGQRIYQQFIDGTIRAIAYNSQKSFVRTNFKDLMQSAFEARSLKPQSRPQLDAVTKELEEAYNKDETDYAQDFAPPSGSSGTDERLRHEYAEYISDYKVDAQKSQAIWKRLLDLCQDLAASVYANEDKTVDWRVSMAVALSENRIAELKDNPVGPD